MNSKTKFNGRHWETGTIHNALAAQGIKAPHTGKPYSEALLLGVSGGITFGYFTFEYKGYLPHVAMLTRNTFSPFPSILERLGIAQDVQQTNQAEIGEKNLRNALDTGLFTIVWADQFSLSYNDLEPDQMMWSPLPILAVETDGKTVTIVDRSSRPFHMSMDELTKARGRIKDDKYRLMTIEAPQPGKLAAAVHKGICQTISLFTEEPPRGARDNFGFAAYEKFAEMLVNKRNKQSWERFFAPGVRMYHALAGSHFQPGIYQWVKTWGTADGADRGTYADFLDEAAEVLNRPGLKDAAKKFRESHSLWLAFADALLPNDLPLLGESKKLIARKHKLFVEKGEDAIAEIQKIHKRQRELLKESENEFPLSSAQAANLRADLREYILKISATEKQAVDMMQNAIV